MDDEEEIEDNSDIPGDLEEELENEYDDEEN